MGTINTHSEYMIKVCTRLRDSAYWFPLGTGTSSRNLAEGGGPLLALHTWTNLCKAFTRAEPCSRISREFIDLAKTLFVFFRNIWHFEAASPIDPQVKCAGLENIKLVKCSRPHRFRKSCGHSSVHAPHVSDYLSILSSIHRVLHSSWRDYQHNSARGALRLRRR